MKKENEKKLFSIANDVLHHKIAPGLRHVSVYLHHYEEKNINGKIVYGLEVGYGGGFLAAGFQEIICKTVEESKDKRDELYERLSIKLNKMGLESIKNKILPNTTKFGY